VKLKELWGWSELNGGGGRRKGMKQQAEVEEAGGEKPLLLVGFCLVLCVCPDRMEGAEMRKRGRLFCFCTAVAVGSDFPGMKRISEGEMLWEGRGGGRRGEQPPFSAWLKRLE
jgi:hypothetical protein